MEESSIENSPAQMFPSSICKALPSTASKFLMLIVEVLHLHTGQVWILNIVIKLDSGSKAFLNMLKKTSFDFDYQEEEFSDAKK
jgi:hypothetical protein